MDKSTPGAEPAKFQIVAIDRDHAKAVAFNMLFMVWGLETRPDAYRAAIRVVNELGARFPEGLGVCQVVEVEAVPPNAETAGSSEKCCISRT